MNEFQGSWVQRRGVMIPIPDEPPKRKQSCRVCGGFARTGLCRPCKESTRERVHGSHAGFNQHTRRNENPCQECVKAEKVYQRKRYRRGALSARDRAWAERDATKHSWLLEARTNRTHDSVAVIS